MRGREGGPSTPLYLYPALHLHFPPKKSSLQKSSAFEFCEPHPPRARSARRAAESVVFFGCCQRKPLRNRFGLSFGDSIQPRSNLFYQPLIFARSARAVALYSASRFECVVLLSPRRFPFFLIFRGGECKIEWRRGGFYPQDVADLLVAGVILEQ